MVPEASGTIYAYTLSLWEKRGFLLFFKFVEKRKNKQKEKSWKVWGIWGKLAQIRRESEACLSWALLWLGKLAQIRGSEIWGNLRNLVGGYQKGAKMAKKGQKGLFLQKNFVPSLWTPKRSEGGGKYFGALEFPLIRILGLSRWVDLVRGYQKGAKMAKKGQKGAFFTKKLRTFPINPKKKWRRRKIFQHDVGRFDSLKLVKR